MEDFWMILEKNLNEKYGRRPVHQISEIRALQNFVGADKIKLIAAFLDDRMLGGILVFIANDLVVHAQYIASDNDFQEYRPLNAVIDFIARKSKVEGFKFFNLGMVNEPGGEILNEGLTRFKEGFGARGVLRETMHIKLV
jgi:lipid II:glycine glycyltransferase (peptidoglycan interpeptide bridge formation enzyme)